MIFTFPPAARRYRASEGQQAARAALLHAVGIIALGVGSGVRAAIGDPAHACGPQLAGDLGGEIDLVLRRTDAWA